MSNRAPFLLIVDDDKEIRDLLAQFFETHGYEVTTAQDGVAMKQVLEEKHNLIDIIILDIMMPGDDGLELCRQLRRDSAIPIIMLSAIGADTDRIVGLELGADDYIAKPFNPRELLARVKAILRRSGNVFDANVRQQTVLTAAPRVRFLDWTLDQNKRRLIAPDDMAIPLSAGEYDLLLAFIEHPGRVLTRDQLLQLTRCRDASPFDRTIDVQVSRLRRKLEKNPKSPTIIKTVRGGGYQFTPTVERVATSEV